MRTEEIIEENEECRSITTKYYDDDGVLVRQDCHVIIKKSPFAGAEQGELN